jgi:hypothetical protein
MGCWLKPWGNEEQPFKRLPDKVVPFPSHPGRPRVAIGDLLVIFGVGTGRLVGVMRVLTEAYDLPESGPGEKNERYPFACDAEVHEGLDLAADLHAAPSIRRLTNAEKLLGGIQYGRGHLKLEAPDDEVALAAIRDAARNLRKP